MQYRNNNSDEIITAYAITEAHYTGENYSIFLPEINRVVGLYPEQTAQYVPAEGDFYIDNGEIKNSTIIAQSDLSENYTEA